MSKMLQALKNLSSRNPTSAPIEEAPAVSGQSARPPAATDPARPPVDHAKKMKEVLARRLSAPTPTEIIRQPNLKEQPPPARDAREPPAVPAAGGMTVPMSSLADEPPGTEMPRRASASAAPPASPASAVVLERPALSAPSAGLPSLEAVSDLLSQLEGEPGGREEEITLSFSQFMADVKARAEEKPDAGEPRGSSPWSEVGGQKSEVGDQKSEVGGQKSEVGGQRPTAAPAGSPLVHLADERPLVAFDTNQEPATPPPAPLALPPRTISRLKTRLEERVLEIQSDPSRSLPYRELAERLKQDVRLLAGRCLLFAGIGPAGHADDVLPYVASLLAEEEAEVLLVDADFARAAMTVAFSAVKESGLGDFAGESNRDDELVLPTRLPNVWLLPAGRRALPDSLGVIDQVAQLLARLEKKYSLVLIDGGAHTSPLLPGLARICDATYFVVRLGVTDARAATAALKSFRAAGARVMGCVATSPPVAAAS